MYDSQTKRHKSDYYPWFDWLRLLLATVVLFGHEGLIGWHNSGNFSVQIFFALSGWLIGGQLVSLPRQELPRFYFNRALRIWAPYFLALALLVCVSLLRDPVTPKWLETVFYDITSVFNLFGVPQVAHFQKAMPLDGTGGHLWSINAEEQFYLLAPLILVVLPVRLGRHVATWICLALIAWLSKSYASIIFGVLAAVLTKQYGEFHTRRTTKIICVAAILASAFGLWKQGSYELISPFCAIAIVLLLAIKGRRHPGGDLAAGISYPMYLNAWIAVFAVNAVFKRFGLQNVALHELLVLALSLAIAALLYWNLDRRLLANKKVLYSPQRARATVIIAYGAVTAGVIGGFLFLRFR